MTVNISGAVQAYDKILRESGAAGAAGIEPRDKPQSGDFAGMVREAAQGAVDTLHKGETQSLQAATGTADLNDVVMAVSNAEMTLQTVVTVRDKVLQAYKDILRMPI